MANKPVLHRRDHEHGGADPVRIVWESTGTGGGGTGFPVALEVFGLHGTTIAAGVTANLDWGLSSGPDTLIQFAGSTPLFIDAGFYVVDASVTSGPLTAGYGFSGYVGFSAVGFQYFNAAAITGAARLRTGRTVAGNGGATGTISISVSNHDTVSRDFQLEALYIYKLG